MKRFVLSLWRAYLRWCQYDCVDLSAAFAYYTLQSIFPLILIILSIASWLLGRQVGLTDQIISYAAGVFPPTVVELVKTTLDQLVRQGFGAGLFGAGALLITAGNVYLTLQRGADRIWHGVLPERQGEIPWKQQVWQFIKVRLEAFVVVLLIGLLIVVDQISANLRMIPATALAGFVQSLPWLESVLRFVPLLTFGRLLFSCP